MDNPGRFGVFSLSSSIGTSTGDPGVDNQGRAIRRRRHHAKSRQGCLTCKSRKVKCDEQRPACRNCSTRRLTCDFDQPTGRQQLAVYRDRRYQSSPFEDSSNGETHRQLPGGVIPPSNIRAPSTPVFDLESMRLMYHFEHFTSDTLLFGKRTWRDQILPLAFQHEYLMHAVLTISASHLHYLQPQVTGHAKAAAMHLDYALSGFREGLNRINASQQDPDIIIACGFILLHYAWSVPFFNVPNDKMPDIESDGLLWFAVGVKSVVLAVYEKERQPGGGIFQTHITADYLRRFYVWSEQAHCSYDFEGNFLRQSWGPHDVPRGSCLQDRGCTNAAQRLVPIFHTVDATMKGQDISDIMPSIMAYALTWPSKAMQTFQDNFRNKSLDAMVTMLSFYASSWLVLSERVWWAHHRSRIMCEAILAHLSREEPSHWDQNISRITEYFGFNKNCDGNWEIGSPVIKFGGSA